MTTDMTPNETGVAWHIRDFESKDLPAIAALFDAADRADHLYKLSSLEDIRASFPDPSTGSQSRIIVVDGPLQPGTDQTSLVGVGRVLPQFYSSTHERIYHLMLRVHPSARQRGLQHTLARHLIEIAHRIESDPSVQPAEKVRVLTYVFESQVSSLEAWQKVGLHKERTGWTMARMLSEPLSVEPVPTGINLRTYRHHQDNLQALNAFNSALSDYYDFHPTSQSSWDREMAAPYSLPDLSWLAFSETAPDRVIGLAGCQVNESQNRQTGRLEGWIEGIGVIPGVRRRGIGKALLSRCLQSFQHAGLEIALADVDSESVAAVALFEGAGFTVRSALLQLECPLGDIRG